MCFTRLYHVYEIKFRKQSQVVKLKLQIGFEIKIISLTFKTQGNIALDRKHSFKPTFRQEIRITLKLSGISTSGS